MSTIVLDINVERRAKNMPSFWPSWIAFKMNVTDAFEGCRQCNPTDIEVCDLYHNDKSHIDEIETLHPNAILAMVHLFVDATYQFDCYRVSLFGAIDGLSPATLQVIILDCAAYACATIMLREVEHENQIGNYVQSAKSANYNRRADEQSVGRGNPPNKT